jgi:uncharacterized protein (TIGR03435 family)
MLNSLHARGFGTVLLTRTMMRPRILLVALASVGLAAQSAPPLSFDAAEIKAVKPSGTAQVSGDYQHGRLIIHNATLHMLINSAFGIRFELIKGPDWIDTDLFDIAAKTNSATSESDSKLMLRTLLAERFKLATRVEPRDAAVYALVLVNRGSKLQPTPAESPDRSGCRGMPLTCHKLSMSALAQMLPMLGRPDIDRMVVDLTGMAGYYDFSLAYSHTTGRSIFDAIGELGLRLEPRKHTIQDFVIDHAERIPE